MDRLREIWRFRPVRAATAGGMCGSITLFRGVVAASPLLATVDDGADGIGGNGDDGDGDRGDDRRDWVIVATFWSWEWAQVARLRLESQGVDCMLLDENLVGTDWLLANAAGGIKLQVRSRQAALARELLVAAGATARLGGATQSEGAAKLADWLAGRLEGLWRGAAYWIGRAGRGWWVPAILPAMLAGHVCGPAAGRSADNGGSGGAGMALYAA